MGDASLLATVIPWADCCFVIADYPIKINISVIHQPSRPSQGAQQEGIKQLETQISLGSL